MSKDNRKLADKYSKTKIAWFPEKLQSFARGELIAPIYVRVKPLNRCNHKCFWCVYHEPEMSGMHGGMEKLDTISYPKMVEILDDFKDMGVKAVTYSGGGEPLMHPDIKHILQDTINRGIDRSVITNGHYLKDETAELLYDAHWVRISIDYHDEESFVTSRRIKGKNFQPVMDNIKAFAENKSDFCDLSVNYIVTEENHKDIYKAAELLVNLGVENIRFSPMWIAPNFYDYHRPIRDEVFSQIGKAIGTLETHQFRIFSSYDQVLPWRSPNPIDYRPYTRCFVKEFNPVVGADLNIYACHNQAYSDDSIIASMENQSFKEAWFSDEAKQFHETFDCQKVCTGQCAADSKNLFITELMKCKEDNFV